MRDILVIAIVVGSVPFILRRPWVGMLMWVWLSLMNPHRMSWGVAYSMPVAQVVAIATFIGLVLSREKCRFPFCGVTVALLAMSAWMSVTTLFAIHPDMAVPQWEKVMKIQVMNFVGLYLLSTRRHIELFAWVTAGSMAFFGVKGGLFTILGGGEYRVYGPAETFIEENNQLALATVMTIPLLYFLQQRVHRRWLKLGLLGCGFLCGFSVLGSHSRGALLAGGAMVAFLWLKSRYKFASLIALAVMVPVMIGFMPQHWFDRMESIADYQSDASAQGRINAWLMAINLVKDRPIVGGGFDLYSAHTFALWAPNPLDIHSSHSNYFQMLGEHGYPGLFLFLLLLLLSWRMASKVIVRVREHAELGWAGDLCRAVQVSMVAYGVGGAFLNLAYFDLPYYLITLVVLTKFLVEKEVGRITPESRGRGVGVLTRGRTNAPPQVAPLGVPPK